VSEHGWTATAPVLRVRDLRASIAYYVDALGFHLDWQAGEIGCVRRDHCCLLLCEGDQTAGPTWVWIGVADSTALHEPLRASGAIVRHPPTNYQWAVELQVADPDGNVLRLGSEPRAGEPFGEWLDASGRRWIQDANGKWTELPTGAS